MGQNSSSGKRTLVILSKPTLTRRPTTSNRPTSIRPTSIRPTSIRHQYPAPVAHAPPPPYSEKPPAPFHQPMSGQPYPGQPYPGQPMPGQHMPGQQMPGHQYQPYGQPGPQYNYHIPQQGGYQYQHPTAHIPPAAPGQQSTYVIADAFDAGARFDGTARPNIPPPPPGVAPNAAQIAQAQGHNVVAGQKDRKFLEGGSNGGYTFW
ncbi:DAZ-associated protein 2 [Halotydeus destructor]|nr:DAZ-associated protein 2 [Halotydeus destructor]